MIIRLLRKINDDIRNATSGHDELRPSTGQSVFRERLSRDARGRRDQPPVRLVRRHTNRHAYAPARHGR